jgi:beta-phosphoglucomutase
MIEAVLFDLDGVLVDACEWHYEALNSSLIEFGYTAISREDHESTYNGLPTKIKLKMLNIPDDVAVKINDKKQEHTLKIISNNAKISSDKIEIYRYLKLKNIKIACVTNSIRETAIAMLKSTGQYEYIDLLVSNEDVTRNKPYPDCYDLAIKKLNCNAINVLCVEDSDKGIQSVMSSVAGHLLVVRECSGLTIDIIKKQIEDIENENINSNGRGRK